MCHDKVLLMFPYVDLLCEAIDCKAVEQNPQDLIAQCISQETGKEGSQEAGRNTDGVKLPFQLDVFDS